MGILCEFCSTGSKINWECREKDRRNIWNSRNKSFHRGWESCSLRDVARLLRRLATFRWCSFFFDHVFDGSPRRFTKLFRPLKYGRDLVEPGSIWQRRVYVRCAHIEITSPITRHQTGSSCFACSARFRNWTRNFCRFFWSVPRERNKTDRWFWRIIWRRNIFLFHSILV